MLFTKLQNIKFNRTQFHMKNTCLIFIIRAEEIDAKILFNG